MTAEFRTSQPASAASTAHPSCPPPVQNTGMLVWARRNLFNGFFNSLLTLLLILALLSAAIPFVRWGLVDAVWQADSPAECAAATGACWVVVAKKHRLMFFGLYPYEEQWRGLAAVVIFVASIGLAFLRWFWTWPRLLALWVGSAVAAIMLLHGGVFDLVPVATNRWGGVMLTFIVFGWTVGVGLPVGVLLALGRRSTLPFIRLASIALIECVRGVPLVTVLFFAAVVFPLALPDGWETDKLLRLLIAMSVFYGCYFAEVVRGGLQAIPKGQYDAATSMALTYWQRTRLVVLPQALRIVIPGLMNHVIQVFKNSTFVVIVGLYDLFNATTAAVADPLWIKYYTEAYLVVALFYFSGARILSRFGQHLERSLAREGR